MIMRDDKVHISSQMEKHHLWAKPCKKISPMYEFSGASKAQLWIKNSVLQEKGIRIRVFLTSPSKETGGVLDTGLLKAELIPACKAWIQAWRMLSLSAWSTVVLKYNKKGKKQNLLPASLRTSNITPLAAFTCKHLHKLDWSVWGTCIEAWQ